MLNVSENFLDEIRLAVCHVKEAGRVILHTILVQRAIGGQQAIEPRTVWSEQLELAYCRLDDPEIYNLVEARVREFADLFEQNNGSGYSNDYGDHRGSRGSYGGGSPQVRGSSAAGRYGSSYGQQNQDPYSAGGASTRAAHLVNQAASASGRVTNIVMSNLNNLASGPGSGAIKRAGGTQLSRSLCLHFFTTKSKKPSVWNLLLGQEEKIVFETWRIPIALQFSRRYTNPEDELLQEATLQRNASAAVKKAVEECVRKIMMGSMDHLPPAPHHLAVYRFEISTDAGAPFSPRAFSQAIKIPLIG